MRHVTALIVDTPPQLPDDINARCFVLEFSDGTRQCLGMVATDLHLLAGELARTALKDLPLRLELVRPEPEAVAEAEEKPNARRRK